jgi:hypothetical protein
MISKFRFLYKAVPLVAMIWAAYWFHNHKSLGFSVKKISSNLAPRPEWAVDDIPKETQAAVFGQHYRYLASGTECYAFVSDDGKYVIKFFRMKHYVPSFSDYFKPDRLKRREKNLQTIFNAYKSAYDELREETGLVFVHLNKTKSLKRQMSITDRLGRKHLIDLDRMEFIVQEKAELIFTRLKRLMDQGDQGAIDRSVQAILGLVQRRIDKGFADQDKAVSHNYGFVGDRPIHLDVGRIFKGKKENEYERIAARIKKWTEENSPQ